ncbi:MAG: TonB-dependent receptor [Novosphingobium sp.]|jgi:outer membrane receptor protein involved in Fe transport|nr:TonB-dependent receptor [Novosphingobium sp.]
MISSATGLVASPRALFLATVAAFVLAPSGVAMAQDDQDSEAASPADEAEPAGDPPPAEYSNTSEIIVTATKHEQTLQDVPVAVTVATAAMIEREHIRDLKALGSIVPSLRISEYQSSENTNFLIRGFGNGANNVGIEPSVGVFIDGVYRSRTASQIADLPDIERIEVLRGPQSTLFGKNASAGVISIITQAPKFDFGGNVEASYGNYNAVVVKGMVTGPVSDTIAASLSGGYNRRDGYIRDLNTGERMNDRNRWFLRGQLLYQPDSQLKVRIIGDYGRIDENCCAVVNFTQSDATDAIRAVGGNINDPADRFGDRVYNNLPFVNRIKNYGVSGQVDYEIGPLSLISITAWRRTGSFNDFDADFTSADILKTTSTDTNIKTFTQEFRATASIADKLTALFGAYYFNEKIRQNGSIQWGEDTRAYADLLIQGASGGALGLPMLEQTFGALEGAPGKYAGRFFAPGQGLDERYALKNEAISVFAQIDFKVTNRLTLTGGVNYTHDSKRFSANVTSSDVFAAMNFNDLRYAPFRNQLLLGGLIAQGVPAAQAQAYADAHQNDPAVNPLNALRALQFLPPFLNVPNAVEPGRTGDGNVSWTARASFNLTDRINLYAGVATGFKASSINLSRDSRPAAGDAAAIDNAGIAVVNQTYGSRFAGPEKATSFEAGIKANWGLAAAKLAVFKQNIRGFQSNIFTGTGFFLGNAGKESVFGIEFEGTVRPVPELTLGVAMTYLDPKYDDFRNSAFGDESGMTPADIPPISATFTAQYDHRLPNDDHLILYGNFHYESAVQVVDGLPGFIRKDAVTGTVLDYQPGLDAAQPFRREVNELNGSITYAMHNGLEFSAWGRNLLDARYISSIFDSVAQAGSISGYTNQPRTYGVSARFRW